MKPFETNYLKSEGGQLTLNMLVAECVFIYQYTLYHKYQLTNEPDRSYE